MAFVSSGASRLEVASRSASRTTKCGRSSRVSMNAASVVEYYFPAGKKNVAPLITFDGQSSVSVDLEATVAEPMTPLLEYPSNIWVADEIPDMGVAWPSGDGRQKAMGTLKGSFSQPNLKEYGPFPDYFKRSCDK